MNPVAILGFLTSPIGKIVGAVVVLIGVYAWGYSKGHGEAAAVCKAQAVAEQARQAQVVQEATAGLQASLDVADQSAAADAAKIAALEASRPPVSKACALTKGDANAVNLGK